MKHNIGETENAGSEITCVKRAGTALGIGAMAVLAVGAVGVYALVGGNRIPTYSNEDSIYTAAETTSVSQTLSSAIELTAEGTGETKSMGEAVLELDEDTSPETETEEKTVSQAAVTMRKAGLDEYDLIVETVKATGTTASKKKTGETAKKSKSTKKDTETATVTAKSKTKTESGTEEKVTSASKKKKSGTSAVTEADDSEMLIIFEDEEELGEPGGGNEIISASASRNSAVNAEQSEVKPCAASALYTIDKVNLRKGSSLKDDVIQVLPVGSEVIVTGFTEDWYRVKYDGTTGYCMKKYFSETAPENTETAVSGENVISYTDTEFDMLCYVLQGEVGNCSEGSKIAVANVVINRVKDPRFPGTIEGVLTQSGQFDAIYGYYNGSTVPSQNTIDCAKRALAGEDNTNGAIYYYAPQYVYGYTASWFESLQFCLELDGQRYFK